MGESRAVLAKHVTGRATRLFGFEQFLRAIEHLRRSLCAADPA
jgi:hypothetical protein